MKKALILLLLIPMSFVTLSCATVGPPVASQEVQAKRLELEAKAAKYKATQLSRVKLIADRLIQFMPPEAKAKVSNIQIKVSDGADINAHASFNELVVNYGMLRFTDSDDQLAAVIGHELAHIVKGHVQKNMATHILAGAAGVAAGAAIDSVGGGGLGGVVSQGISNGVTAAFSRDFEREADYYGFQYLYVAGFDVLKGAEIWERFAIEAPKSMTTDLFSTHPSSPERLIRAEKVLQEVTAQGVTPNLFQVARSSNVPVPSIVPALGFNSSSKSSSSSVQASADPAANQEELKQLQESIARLKQEQLELQQNLETQKKIQGTKADLERGLLEANEASKELRYEEFGIKDLGIAKKVTNLLIAKKVEGEQRIFKLGQGSIDWFVQYDQNSVNSLKSLALIHRKYRVYWYSPNKKLYSEQAFGQSEVRTDFAKATLQWDPELGDYLVGEWRVRVFEEGKIIDDRTFEVIK